MKVITKRGTKDPMHMSSGNKSHITVVCCASAAGISIPPMILFNRQTLHADMALGEVPWTYYGLNSGWMNQELDLRADVSMLIPVAIWILSLCRLHSSSTSGDSCYHLFLPLKNIRA